ncbi:MAG TPA: hypothetical protein VKB45_12495 [Gemmatimonadales bacterium]|nr:hypothetical protein [Gemmatimonadales bacterium]
MPDALLNETLGTTLYSVTGSTSRRAGSADVVGVHELARRSVDDNGAAGGM